MKTMLLVVMMVVMMVIMVVVMMNNRLSMWERSWVGKKWSRLDDCEDDCDNASDDKDLLTYADIFLHILTSPYLF